MAPRPKIGEKADDNDEALFTLQGQIIELSEELKRVKNQRFESDKENHTLRREIRRMKKEFQKQISEVVGAAGEGATKIDAVVQTENMFEFECGKNVNNEQRNQAGHNDLITNQNNKKSTSNNNDNISEVNNRDNHFENNEYESRSNFENQNNFMGGLMKYFESLQVSIPLPKFDGVKKNPLEFIKDLEKYFARRNVTENLKLISIEDSLIGKAKMWHDARAFPFISFNHFKEKFLEEFYSIEARMNVKSEWENRRLRECDISLQGYYTEQLRDFKYCLSSLAEYEKNFLIVKQLPQRAREVLATIDYNKTSKIM